MMKSFFKKLAFVMALAMVVTMAAPAGTSALAAGIYLAEQNDKTKTAVTEVKVDVEKTYDLRFYGAPTNWKEDYKWTSDDETVATVNQDGLITGVKDGETVVTFRCFEEEVDVKVVVGAGKAATGYTVTQATAAVVNVVFNGTTEYTEKDIELFYVLDGGYPVSWPIKEFKEIEGGYSVEPYVAFVDGASYLIKVGGEADPGFAFTTSFGVPTHLVVEWECNGKKNENAYVDPEGIDAIPLKFNTKFFSGDVDVTALYNKTDVVYELLVGNEDVVYLDSYEGALYFDQVGEVAVVKAEYIYFDPTTETEVPITGVTDSILSVGRPAYAIKGLADWTIAKVGTPKKDLVWGVHSIRANDDADASYIVVAKFLDSFGNYVVTNDAYADEEKGVYGPSSAYKFRDSNLSFEFTSALPSKMLIGHTDATLTTYVDAKVATIISLRNSDGVVKNVGAVTVEVTEQRSVDRLTVSSPSVALTTDGDYTTAEVTLTVIDQYREAWKYATASDIEITGTGAKEAKIVNKDAAKGTFTIQLNGKTMKTALDGKYSTSLTIELDDVKTTLRVSLKDPKYNEGNTIRVTGWELKVDDIDLKLTSSKKVVLDGAGPATKEEALVPIVNKITLTQESNGLPVGVEEEVGFYNSELRANEASVGARFIAVYDTNNDLVAEVTTAADGLGVVDNGDGTFALVVGCPDGDTMDYIKLGTYTVKVKEITSFKANEMSTDEKTVITYGKANYRDRYTKTFKVTNSSSTLSFKGLESVEAAATTTTIDKLVLDLVQVNLNGKQWNFKDQDIVEVKGRYNANAGYVIITSVTFNVPLNAEDTTKNKEDEFYGYEQTVEVNQAIEVAPAFKNEFVNGKYTNTWEQQ